MLNQSVQTFYATHYFANLKRHANFYFMSNINEAGTGYRIHIFADHVASVDIYDSTEPLADLEKHFEAWKDAVIRLFS
jgi:hypothetical protein